MSKEVDRIFLGKSNVIIANQQNAKAGIGDIIDIRWRGATPDSDCHDIIMQIIEEKKIVYIPKGVWRTSPLTITYPFQIIGEMATYIDKYDILLNCSVLAPIRNQTHIINYKPLDVTNKGQFRLKDIVLSCMIDFRTLYLLNVYDVDYCLKIENACYGEVDLIFTYCTGKCFIIKDSWEIDFKRLYFRTIKSVEAAMTLIEGKDNISQCNFEKIQFESVPGTYINAIKSCNLTNCIFDSIICECSPFEYMSRLPADAGYKDIPLFIFASTYSVVINSILINNLNQYSYVGPDGISCTRKTIFKITDTSSWINIKIQNVMIDSGTEVDFNILDAQMTEAYPVQQRFAIDSVIYSGFNNVNNNIRCFTNFSIRKLDYLKNYSIQESIAKWYHVEYDNALTRCFSSEAVLANNEKCYVQPTSDNIWEVFGVFNLAPGEKMNIVVEGIDGSSVDFRFVGYTLKKQWNITSNIISKKFTSSNANVLTYTNATIFPLIFLCQAKNRVGIVKIYSISK